MHFWVTVGTPGAKIAPKRDLEGGISTSFGRIARITSRRPTQSLQVAPRAKNWARYWKFGIFFLARRLKILRFFGGVPRDQCWTDLDTSGSILTLLHIIPALLMPRTPNPATWMENSSRSWPLCNFWNLSPPGSPPVCTWIYKKGKDPAPGARSIYDGFIRIY